MASVHVFGWCEGFDKIGMNHLLREATDCRLIEAKRLVDALLDGQSFVVEIDDVVAFCASATLLGASCSPENSIQE